MIPSSVCRFLTIFRVGEFVLLVFASLFSSGTEVTASLRPENLRCEYAEDPLGIDIVQPRLSWMLVSTEPKSRSQF